MGVRTAIELRNELEVTAEYRAIEERIKKHETALAALELHIGPYLQNRKRIPLLNAKFRMKITDLVGKYDYVQTSLEKLKDAVKKMKEAKPAEADSRVNVTQELHEGVVLSTSSCSLEIKEFQKGPVSYRPMESLGKWVVVSYQPLLRG
jgi:chromosome segregation ATPase